VRITGDNGIDGVCLEGQEIVVGGAPYTAGYGGIWSSYDWKNCIDRH